MIPQANPAQCTIVRLLEYRRASKNSHSGKPVYAASLQEEGLSERANHAEEHYLHEHNIRSTKR